MRNPENEVVCTACGDTHFGYPAKHCRDCGEQNARDRADIQRAARCDR